MKKLKMSSAVLISLILVIALAANGCSREDIPFLGNGEKSEKALKAYAKAVQQLKNEDDFDLKLTTSIELKEINCSLPFLNSILKKVVEHRFGQIEDEVLELSFANGVLKGDNTVVPDNVVQPVNSSINWALFDGVTSSYLDKENDTDTVYFVIGEETATVEEVMTALSELQKEVGTDLSGYDIHKEYPKADALAKYHSNFIDLMSVAPRIKSLMDMNNDHVHSEEDEMPDYGDFGKTTQIENGTCMLGDTFVTAQLDQDGRLTSVYFNAPLGMEVNIKIFHNQFKAVVRFTISQTYEYSYSE